jgi:hypothetical protein
MRAKNASKRHATHFIVFMLPLGRLTVSRSLLSKGLHRFIRLDIGRR